MPRQKRAARIQRPPQRHILKTFWHVLVSRLPDFGQSGPPGRFRLKWPGDTIYFQGESADRLYLVKKGRVRVFYVTKAGKELTFEVIEKGKLIGESSFLSHSVYPVSAAAVNQVELLECDLHGLYAYMEESPQLMYVIIQLLSRTCNHLTEQLRRITLYDRYQKIASFLLHETAYPDRDRGVTDDEIPYTHEELALSLGMNRVTVSKVLSQWKQEGILSAGYGRIQIKNRRYLEDLLKKRP